MKRLAAAVLASLPVVVIAAASCANPCGGGGGGGFGEEEGDDDEGGGAFACGGPGGYAATPPAGSPAGATCSTDLYWQRGDAESEAMHPGVDCVSCHARGEGPNYFLAGTVNGAVDDADDCQGISDVTVSIVDADGQAHDIVTNSAGNFYFGRDIPVPYTVTITRAGRSVSMVTPQTDGACLSCHTVDGRNGAPGRIVAP